MSELGLTGALLRKCKWKSQKDCLEEARIDWWESLAYLDI